MIPRDFAPTEAFARQLDEQDSLAGLRDAFYRPPGQTYLDGNSLGLLCRPAEHALLETLQQWKRLAIGGWLDASPAWFVLAEQLGARLAPLIGADPAEVVVANSTTVNLHQLLATFYNPDAAASCILADALCFPTDRYAIHSFLRQAGQQAEQAVRFVGRQDEYTLSEEAIIQAMTDDVQIVVVPSVVYTTGQLLDIGRLTHEAHDRGLLIGFDCSHSVGVVPHHLDQDDVDFAFFCTYKYLNGGPGSPAAIYLHRRHFGRRAGLAGWFGSDKDRQFDMSDTFQQAPHAGALQIGTPPILSAAPLRGALELIDQAGIQQIRAKSLQLTAYLRELVNVRLNGFGFRCVTPLDAARRGGHIAISHPHGRGVSAALRQRGVVADFRPPDLIRLAPSALYTSYLDCYQAVEILVQVMQVGAYAESEIIARHIP